MADSKKPAAADRPVEAASAAPGEQRAAVRPRLAKASESGDPAVQKLLADRWAVQQNAAMHAGAVSTSSAAQAGHGDGVAQIDAALAELGFE